MAKVFLDANYLIGLVNRSPETDTEDLHKHQGYISTLSCHILFYVNKISVPDAATNSVTNDFNHVGLSKKILITAQKGPTKDLEDNIQLHSAIEADCDYFLPMIKNCWL